MTSQELLRRLQASNQRAKRTDYERGLTIVNLGHTRLGDVIQAITNLRYLERHLRIRQLDINLIDPAEHRLAAEMLKHDPQFGQCLNLSYEEIPFAEYQVVLHYTVFKDSDIIPLLAEKHRQFDDHIAFYSLPASQWDLRNRYGDAWQEFVYPLPLLDAPLNLLQDAVGNHRVYLSADEQAWATRWLIEAGVSADETLIVFVDEASAREKMLNPICMLRVLEHLLSMAHTKVLIYDVRDQGKQDIYQKALRPELFAKMVFSTRNGLRRDLALLGAPQVKLIFGPDTGIMHGAVGVHAALEHAERADDRPQIVVYAGRWRAFNQWNFWSHSSACCLMPYETSSGTVLKSLPECPRDDAGFQAGLRGVSTISAPLMIECLESRFLSTMREAMREAMKVMP